MKSKFDKVEIPYNRAYDNDYGRNMKRFLKPDFIRSLDKPKTVVTATSVVKN